MSETKQASKVSYRIVQKAITNASLTFTGIGVAVVAHIGITPGWAGICTTFAVWVTSCKTQMTT